MSMLELRRVSKVYGQGTAGVHALADVGLSVDEGEMVAVMAPSGSGKSTLLTIAGSLEEPSSGEVLAGGQSLSHMSRNARMCRRSGPALSPRQPRMAVARTLAVAAAAIVLLVAACGPSGGEAKRRSPRPRPAQRVTATR
jgi:ABC-type methionine transport system ATPase subunit